MSRLRSALVAAALVATLPSAARGQLPVLHGATLFHATATGDNDLPDAVDLGQFRGSWRTNPGILNTYAGMFFRDVADAAYGSGSTLNPGGGLAQTLAAGDNTFYFYASGMDRLGRTHWGLNLWFGAGPQTDCAEPPRLSAVVLPGAGAVAAANASATTTTQCQPPNNHVSGAGALSWSDGQYVVTLTDFRVLAEADAGSPYDRVSQTAASPDGTADTYGTLTLSVTRVAAVPEPSTWALLGTGLGGLLLLRRRRVR